jgi:hypothetical protein
MSEMEAAAKPVLWPLIHAEGRRLDATEQRVLAGGALLKACVFDELPRGEGVVLPAHRGYLYEHRDPPPPGFRVNLATYEAVELRHYAHQGLRLTRGGVSAPPGPNVYFVTITAGALVVQVTGISLPGSPVQIPISGPVRAGCRRDLAWPDAHPLSPAQGDDARNVGRLHEDALQRDRSPRWWRSVCAIRRTIFEGDRTRLARASRYRATSRAARRRSTCP